MSRKINIDSEKFKDLILNFNNCIKIYNDSISEFFNLIKSNPTWGGFVGDEYILNLVNKKRDYIQFGNELSKFSSLLSSAYDELESSNIKTGDI